VTLANPCLATGEVDGACANATSTVDLTSLAVSADGRFLYATADSSDAIDVFARDSSGLLTQTGCLMHSPPPGPCTASGLVDSPTDIALSADGKNAYVVDTGNLVVATRNATTGALNEVSCIDGATSADSGSGDNSGGGDSSGSDSRARASQTDSGSCSSVDGITGLSAVAVSPDGANVYVSNVAEGGLVTFTRDPATGALTESSCAASSDYLSSNSSSSCVMSPASAANQLVVSPDGRNVYVLDPTDDALYGFGPAAAPAAGGARLSSDGKAALRIVCPSAARSLCVGSVQLASLPSRRVSGTHRSVRRPHRSHTASAARSARPPVSSAAGFRVAPGHSAVVYVRVPRTVRGAVRRRRGGMRLLAEVQPVPGGGGASLRVVVLR
jgi:DNA-binding beta-propeller fold protein YncE